MNTRLYTKILSSLLVGLLLFGSSHTAIWAQDGLPSGTPSSPADPRVLFAVRPADDPDKSFFDNVEIEPGQSIELEMVVLNWGDVPVDLSVYKANVTNPVNGGFQVGQASDTPTKLTSWIEFDQREVSLLPKTQQVMAFTISIPNGTEPGQYVSSMVASTIDNLPIPGSETIDHQLRFAMAVSIIVPGEITSSFELGDPVIVENRLQIPVSNTGNYVVKPEGSLVLTDQTGTERVTSDIRMDSVYGGNSTHLEVRLPEQLAPGEYTLVIELKDPTSGFSSKIQGKQVTIAKPVEPKTLTVTDYSIEPNGADITYANVDVSVRNDGGQLSAANVYLNVFHNGNLIDEFPLATNQVLVNGENKLSARYIPADKWQSGTYTFEIVVHLVNPNGGSQTKLLNESLDVELVVP